MNGILGLILVLVSGILLFIFSMPKLRNRWRVALRPIASFKRLQRAIGLSVEDGKRLHLSLGNSSVLDTTNASALVGVIALERIAMLSMLSDRPPIATSANGTFTILSQDVLHASYRQGNVIEQYSAARGRLSGVTPFAYVVGTMPFIRSENVSTHVLLGNFGSEVGLLIDAAEGEGANVFAGSDSLTAQSVMFATAHEPLIGEELFALPAYLRSGHIHQQSLRVQDILRWAIAFFLVIGSLLKLIGAI